MSQNSNLDNLVPGYIRHFNAYVPSRPDDELKKLYGCPVIYRMNNNENPLGPPPEARQVIKSFHPKQGAVYPSGDSYYLRLALAERFGKHPERFLVGNGSNEVITTVIKAFCGPGDNIITADRTFAVYEWVAEFSGFEARLVPLKDYTFDDETMLRRMDENTKIIFICNPNNPTGTYWNKDRMIRFLNAVNGRCLVVLDEAYFEFVEREDYPDGMELMEKYGNVLVFRTFSKMYGLAALRIGYLCGTQEAVSIIRKTYVVYSVNRLAQAAAPAAMKNDREHISMTRELVREGKEYLYSFFGRMGLKYLRGEGCYVMVQVPGNDTVMYRRLMKYGFMVRTMTGFRFPGWLRITTVPLPVLKKFAEIFGGILEQDKNIYEHKAGI